ncbi:MAG TPA: ABC transporter ATP-binding protein [Anaerolineaceae bacterium]|nr:ABC transporter ATP-binding protein [Anaerolineaceae bacterium]
MIPIIGLENVSVRYRVPSERLGTFKEYAIRWLQGKVHKREFWALDNVSFTVNKGEVFGVIGSNGAGKSTMLKLIARVLRPTSGRVWVNGRVAPLLELGAGFHPELSGRENIYLNGAMLGYSRREMTEKYQRIVEFSEIGDFIDSPIRTYSSGMMTRLGFAVATDERPDILLLDEVMAVGDLSFQNKCNQRISSYRADGSSIFMVSHTMSLILEMCDRVVWLEHGKLRRIGNAVDIVEEYSEYQTSGVNNS